MRCKQIAYLLLFSLLLISPGIVPVMAASSAEYVDEPKLDSVRFYVVTQDDQQVLKLKNGQIDLIGDDIDWSFYQDLDDEDDIEVENHRRQGYGAMYINCQKYPFNITAFRRAIAYALDKGEISDNVWDGTSSELDNVIPAGNPLSAEGLLPETYYQANVAKGASLLANAGFENLGPDGFLNAPDGSEFDVTIEVASTSSIAIQVGDIFKAALLNLDINATTKLSTFAEYYARVESHGDYDMAFIGKTCEDLDVRWMAEFYHSDNSDVEGQNYPGFENSSFDALADTLVNSVVYEDVREAALEMQEIIWYECPVYVCYQNYMLYAYRSDEFHEFKDSPLEGYSGWWTRMDVEPLTGTGGMLNQSISLDIDSFNFMVSSSQYAWQVNQMLWDTLLVHGIDEYCVPNFAYDWTIETHDDDVSMPEGHMRIIFNLVEGTGCSDGTELTADDVVYSINFYNESGCKFNSGLDDLTSISAPSPYVLVCEFETQTYWNLITIGQKPILNQEYFEDTIELEPTSYALWSPDPVSGVLPSTGPYNITNYVPGEFIEISRNPFYVRGVPLTTPITTSTTSTSSSTTETSTNTNTTGTQTGYEFLSILTQYGLYIGVGIAVVIVVVIVIKKR